MNIEGALVSPDWSVHRVMDQINRNGQGIAVVVDESRRLLATVTDGDIRRAILGSIDLALPIRTLVEQRAPAPHGGLITAPEGAEAAELLRLMTDLSIRHVPIVDAGRRVVDVVALTELIKDYELPITAIIMAGGPGPRLRPLTENLPKPMLPVAGRPLMEITIEQLRRAGIRRVNLSTHYKKDIIAEHFGDGREFGVDIQYVEEKHPLGTAGSLSLLEVSDEPLLVINGDILTSVDFRAMLDFHREQRAEMTVAVRRQEFRVPYGVVETDGVVIIGMTEKPVLRHFINAGIYLLNPEVRRYIPGDQAYDMSDLIGQLVSDGRRVVSFPVQEYWRDIGRHEDYQHAQADAEREGFVQA